MAPKPVFPYIPYVPYIPYISYISLQILHTRAVGKITGTSKNSMEQIQGAQKLSKHVTNLPKKEVLKYSHSNTKAEAYALVLKTRIVTRNMENLMIAYIIEAHGVPLMFTVSINATS